MADEAKPKSNPKPVPKPGTLKPATAPSSKKTKDIKSLTGRQKAAIFLVSVGSDVSSEIMKHLREDEVETLTFEIARLETVDAELKDQVLEEFQDLMNAQNFITTGGIDYARELLEKSLGSQKAIDIINRLTSSLQVRPFDFIRRTDPAHLLNFIQQEYPQTIALILAYLEPGKAAIILQNLPEEMQPEVSKRLATMDRTSPDVLREVERVLEKKLSHFLQKTTLLPVVLNLSLKSSTLLTALLKKQLSNLSKKKIQTWQKKSKSVCSFSKISLCWTTVLSRKYSAKSILRNLQKRLNQLILKYRIRFSATCQNVLQVCLKKIWNSWDQFA